MGWNPVLVTFPKSYIADFALNNTYVAKGVQAEIVT